MLTLLLTQRPQKKFSVLKRPKFRVLLREIAVKTVDYCFLFSNF